MHSTRSQGEPSGQGVTADSGQDARAALQRPPASHDFPALGGGPQQSQSGARTDQSTIEPLIQEGRGGSQRPAGGWVRLLQRPAAAGVSRAEGVAPTSSDGGLVDGEETTDTAPARARKAAAAEQLHAEARRSVVDAMTGVGKPAPAHVAPACAFIDCVSLARALGFLLVVQGRTLDAFVSLCPMLCRR